MRALGQNASAAGCRMSELCYIEPMAHSAVEVIEAALALSKSERLKLAEKLLASVDEIDPHWAEAWKTEMAQREAAPESECEPWTAAYDELKSYAERP